MIAHDHLVEPAAEVAGRRRPSGMPTTHAIASTSTAITRRDPGAVEHAGEHVPADLVGAEPVLRRRRPQRYERVRGRARVGRDTARSAARAAATSDDQQRDQRRRPASSGLRAAARRRRAGRGGAVAPRGRAGCRAPRSSAAGSSGRCAAWTMSTTRLATT